MMKMIQIEYIMNRIQLECIILLIHQSYKLFYVYVNTSDSCALRRSYWNFRNYYLSKSLSLF
jgi:hypothetical protein